MMCTSIRSRCKPYSALPFLLIVVCLGLIPGASASAATRFPIVCKSNTIYDGGGATIDARKLKRVFNVWNVKNVTIKNWKIIGSDNTRMIDISKAEGVRVDNITVRTSAAEVVHVHSSANVSINRVVADVIDRYLVWIDNSDAVRVARCALITGSKSETGIRVMDWTSNVIVEGCTIRARLNKQTAMRLHDGSNFLVRHSQFEGHVWTGPMGGDDGGQKVYNLSKRSVEISRRTTDVTFQEVDIVGSIGPQAGLSGFAMIGGSITTKTGTPFFSSPFNNTTWSYPDRKFARAGDDVRPAPSGVMQGVRIIAPGTRTLNYGSNGPFRLHRCSLNGQLVRG